ncbi:MAG TPA: SMC family ATPase [Nocardioides sp.]|nr:SMC family ATPase [Nocardioides sp.]
MRLHHLQMTAFGPFAGTESVDFDALNDAGLFLLSGATGAGKTSILDAVCFALYGTVPGARGVKTLKSQHADDHVEPEVVLEFSVRERRFRVRRSPEWTRPKRRGSGTRTENAKASLTELTTGDEHFRSSRASEVGQLVSDLVGMRAAQFQQVAMLPQGDFARFLHASSQERHDVLQHLFRTDRFRHIEDWVQDHSRDLRTRAEGAGEQVQRLLHTIADRSGAPVADEDETSWARSVLDDAEARLQRLRAARVLADAEEATARAAADEARRIADTARRRDDAVATLAELDGTEADALDAARRLDDDRRAGSCGSVLALLDRAVDDVAVTRDARRRAVDQLENLEVPDVVRRLLPSLCVLGPAAEVDVARVDAAVEDVRSLTGTVQALLPRLESLRVQRERERAAAADLAEATDLSTRLAGQREALPDLLTAARAAQTVTRETAARAEMLGLRLEEARQRADAVERLPIVASLASELEDAQRDARDAAADARERVQDLQARRLAGIAAELAGGLRPGDPCQVCGSTDHPRPADHGAGSPVTEQEQALAEKAYQEAQERLVDATRRVTAQRGELTALRQTADGVPADDARATVLRLEREVAEAEAARDRLPGTEAEVATLEEALDEVSEAVHAAQRTVTAVEEKQRAAREAAVDATAQIEAALPGADVDDVPAVAAALEGLAAGLLRARVALVQHEQAVRRVEELEAQAAATVADHGFPDVDAARRARLEARDRVRLQLEQQERDERAVLARAVLESTEVRALPSELPDLDATVSLLDRASTAARDAGRAADLQHERTEALRSLVARLDEAVTRWRPLRDEHERAEAMSRLVRGMGSDNHLQMRLSAYVLATRLDQVLDAANERLSHMRDQRYLLQRTHRAARKGSQAGLGLEVVDQWTGDVRDPATLSGGETFVVSLSLALGLADVVTAEAGGTEIETLFVDEGFGTLDPDTLDDVMDRLDGLRAGGRTVGVVSHVTELRTRIPAQVNVRKTPRGSTVHAEMLVG